MRRARLVPLLALALLAIAAGGFLAAASASDDGPPAETDRPAQTPRADRSLDDVAPNAGNLLPLLRRGPFIGIALADEGGDVVVQRVVAGGPADEAGVHEDDVVEAVNGRSIGNAQDVIDLVGGSEPGDVLRFQVIREGESLELDVEAGERRVIERPFDGDLFPLAEGGPPDLFGLAELRGRLGARFDRLVEGQLSYLNENGERESVRLVAGSVARASETAVVVTPNGGGGEEEFTIGDDTRIVRGARRGDAGALEQGDRIVVVAQDESRDALIILAFPAREEESP